MFKPESNDLPAGENAQRSHFVGASGQSGLVKDESTVRRKLQADSSEGSSDRDLNETQGTRNKLDGILTNSGDDTVVHLNGLQDGATERENVSKDGGKKRTKTRPTRRKGTKKSVDVNRSDSTLPQKGGAIGIEGRRQLEDGARKQHQRQLQSGSEAKKSVDVINNDQVLLQNGLLDGATGMERGSREESRKPELQTLLQSASKEKKSLTTRNQEQRGPQHRSGVKEKVAVITNDSTASEKDSATGTEGGRHDGTRKQDQRCTQGRSEIKKSVAVDHNSTLSQKDSARRKESGKQDLSRNGNQRHPQSGKQKSKQKVRAKSGESTQPQKQGVARKEGERQDGARKEDKRRPQDENEAKNLSVAVSNNALPPKYDATKNDGERKDGTRNQDQRRPQNRSAAEESVAVSNNTLPPKYDATQKDGEGKDGKRNQDQRRPQNRSDAEKSGVVSNNALPPKYDAIKKDGERNDGTRNQEQRRPQNRSEEEKTGAVSNNPLPPTYDTANKDVERKDGTRNQDQRHPQNRSDAEIRGAVSNNPLPQKYEATGMKSEREGETRTQGQGNLQITNEAKTSAAAGKSSDSSLPEKGGATEMKSKRQGGTRKQDQRRPQNTRGTKKSVVEKSSDNTLPQKDGATGIESERKDGTRKQGQKRPQSKSDAKQCVVVNGNNDLSQKDGATEVGRERQEETRKQDQRRRKSGSEVNKSVSVNKNDDTWSRNSATGKEGKRKADTRKQEEGRLQNRNEATKSDNTLAQKDGSSVKESETQGEAKNQDQRCPQNRIEVRKMVAVNSSDNTLPQSGPQDGTTRRETENLNGPSQHTAKRKDIKSTAVGRSKRTSSQSNIRDFAAEKEGGNQSGFKKLEQLCPQKSRDNDERVVLQSRNINNYSNNNCINNGTSLENDVRNQKTECGAGIQVGIQTRDKSVKEHETTSTVFGNGNPSPQKDGQGGVTRKQRKEHTKRKERQTINQESLSIEAMRELLKKSPEEIANRLISDHFHTLLEKQQKMKDDAVIVLVRLLAKACDCESSAVVAQLPGRLQTSWFLTRRVDAMFEQLLRLEKSKVPQVRGLNLDAIRDIVKLLTDIFSRLSNSCPSALLDKLHKVTMILARSGQPVDRGTISAIQEINMQRKREEFAQARQTRRPPRAAMIPGDRSKPPENFRQLSVIPTPSDITDRSHDRDPSVRKNKIKGRYYNEEHYLDVQFRLFREDFLRPLRDGIQQLIGMPNNSGDDSDEHLQNIRNYEHVRILNTVCTSTGIRYRIRFDVSKFAGLQWENSKRLIFGSLLCLSKDNFKTFVFATVADRVLENVKQGAIEIRFVSPPSEARPRTGDLCQMVESIAFFEGYRPVLEGLKMMCCGKFPLKRYIVKCNRDVRPPAYLRKRDGRQVVFDFSPIMTSEAKSSSTLLQERNDQREVKDTETKVTVLDPASWPSAKDLELDESQFNALQLALTKEFAVIQGPPGTGKTYIGLKIAKVLLHNQSTWSANETGRPILVVCYTNHALDQFLEGILEFHQDRVIRVGGRSQSEAIKACSLSELKRNPPAPTNLRQAFGEIRKEMEELSEIIGYHDTILEELKRRVFDEDELKHYATSMTSQQHDSLVKDSHRDCVLGKRRESVIPQWLGLPVQPTDPYQDGFAQPLAMFPFNAECWGLEYFTQEEVAYVTQFVQPAPGPDGNSGGSLQFAGTFDSFIEIPNFCGGPVDAERSITLLAFVYPTGSGGPIVSYHHIYGLGVQLWHEGFHDDLGILRASFVHRDLLVQAAPLSAPVLKMNDWNFIGASYDHVSGMARLWHNGNEVNSDFIGKDFDLATQLAIRIGAVESPGQEYYFTGRISHLHIYADALTVENIQAVGSIPQQFTRGTKEGPLDVETDEEKDESNESEEDEGREDERGHRSQEWKSPSFKFDADVMEDQRILKTDEVIRFDAGPLDEAISDDLYAIPRATEGDSHSGGWQFQNAHRIRKKIKKILRKELNREDMMSSEEATEVEDVWNLSEKERWCLYRKWVYDARETCYETIFEFQEMFDAKAEELQELRYQEDYQILREADVIGMTTTGAARYHNLLQDLQPAITIVEEAAEVFEAHTVTSLTPGCQHLILIGDHQQLRPNPTVYDLEINYNLDVSLFERMVTNGMQFERLSLQHRMRPEIAKMLDHIYVKPKLQNHDSVLKFEDIKGVERNLFFVDHEEKEDHVDEGKSKSNVHEATFLTALCRYFIQQGYQREQITVLVTYSGQLSKVKKEMLKDKEFFEGVRVTAVDNYQGEENDIILLSLVRSNRIGFLKIANRVCVALSRARKGFYIIGNATLLAQQDPALWGKIIADMRNQGNLGSHLKLVCQNHPQNVIEASRAEDFEKAPEGGCEETCLMRMPDCEHLCVSVCHPIDVEHKEKFACQQPCTKLICDLRHNCWRRCSEECAPCMVRVPKIIPGCQHEQVVPCSLDPSEFKCRYKVPKQAFPCGHVNEVECFVAPSDIVCKVPCGALECGHPCPGYCNRCQEGRLHLPCNSTCDRTLFCGHKCKDLCVRACPPCSEPCGLCKRSCGHPCQRTERPCPHHEGTELCAEPYKSQRCEKPCQEQLSCGHSCVGICGEVCPKLCRVCNEDAAEFSGSDTGAMFVELVDCGHVIDVKTLNQWLDKSGFGGGENEDVEIKQKRCPKCNTLILHGLKTILADFEAIKFRIFRSGVASRFQIKKIQNDLQKIKGIEMETVKEIDRCISKSHVTSEQITKHQNQVIFLKFLGNLITKYKITNESSKELYCRITLLISRIMISRRVCFSEQEIKEFIEELSRTKLLVCFNCLMTALNDRGITLAPEDSKSVDAIRCTLDSGKAIGCQRRKEFMADINRIKRRHGFSKDVDATDTDSELKNMIVKTKNLAQGPWYKCRKAHIYSAAERIEEEGSIKCPDCLSAAKGNSDRRNQRLYPLKYEKVKR